MHTHLRKLDKRASTSVAAPSERSPDWAERLRLQTEFVVRRYGVPAPRAETVAVLMYGDRP